MTEQYGKNCIFDNNKSDAEQCNTVEMTDDEKIDFVAERILKKYRSAFEELAK